MALAAFPRRIISGQNLLDGIPEKVPGAAKHGQACRACPPFAHHRSCEKHDCRVTNVKLTVGDDRNTRKERRNGGFVFWTSLLSNSFSRITIFDYV